jgi:hypothetical protein
VRFAANEHGNLLLDADLVRLRAEWIKSFQEWHRVAEGSPDAILTAEQRTKLRRYFDAEAAYFIRYRTLVDSRYTDEGSSDA